MLKRLIDVTISALVLAVCAPLLLTIALATLADSGRPIIFQQLRIGRGYQPFVLLKFRTMRTGRGSSITVQGDRRVTRFGNFLRSSKLDELPQFLNVLRGEMSLIGPRPEIPEFVDIQSPVWGKILAVKPGLVDPASLQFQREAEMLARYREPVKAYREHVLPQKLAISCEYLLSRSVLRDFRLLVSAANVMLKGILDRTA